MQMCVGRMEEIGERKLPSEDIKIFCVERKHSEGEKCHMTQTSHRKAEIFRQAIRDAPLSGMDVAYSNFFSPLHFSLVEERGVFTQDSLLTKDTVLSSTVKDTVENRALQLAYSHKIHSSQRILFCRAL